MKRKIVLWLTRLVGRKHHCFIENDCMISSHMVKSRFSNVFGSKEYPVEISSSRIVGDIHIGMGCKIIDSVISSHGGGY